MRWDGSNVHRARDRGRLAYQKPKALPEQQLEKPSTPLSEASICAIIVAQKAKAKEPSRPQLQGQIKRVRNGHRAAGVGVTRPSKLLWADSQAHRRRPSIAIPGHRQSAGRLS